MKKLRLVKITPSGHDPERMVVTEDSTAHEMVRNYATENAYNIVEHECANRFECILADLERIRTTIAVHCPIIMKQPGLDSNCKPYNDELSQCFTNIEIACNEEMDEPEFAWMNPTPTYEEYTKDMSLQKKLEMYYDADIDSPATSYKWTCKDIAEIVDNADWLPDFEKKFKEYLEEREYIQEPKDTSIDEQTESYTPHREGDE
jgi:hypothetical protein